MRAEAALGLRITKSLAVDLATEDDISAETSFVLDQIESSPSN